MGSLVVLMSMKNGDLICKTGFVDKINIIYRTQECIEKISTSENFFNIGVQSTNGDSGSIISNYEGRIFGFLTSGAKDKPSTQSNIIYRMIELIETYRGSLLK